jgi:putative two-component system response regulator
MPHMTGIQLCQAIRRDNLPGYVYFILLTSHNSIQEKIEGLRAGADDFITKPYNAEELLARIQTGERILSLETRDIAIFALAKLAESRDPETGAHLERIQNFSRVLAQQLAGMEKYRNYVSAEFIRLVYSTSPLHDIGKVGIPDSVLLKPARLTDEEWAIMKAHATIGAETLDAALVKFPRTAFLQMARDIAAYHHERYDGAGYPKGLKGDQIPLAARIVALADVYDALTSKRVYREAFTHHLAKNMILEDKGSHFDPDIVDAFVECQAEFKAIHNRFSETGAGLRKAFTE